MKNLKIIQFLLDLMLFISVTLMILIAPYTKVEESFNVQAIHDLINLNVDEIEKFDHISFQGVVKRTCLGALLISLPSIFLPTTMKKFSKNLILITILINKFLPTPINLLSIDDSIFKILNLTKISQLLISRFLLSIFSCFSIIYLRKSLNYSCSKNSNLIGFWFSLLYYPLPHIIFYSSRFLPNFICLPFFNIAISMFISGDISRSISLFLFIGIIFRFEILFFTGILIFFSINGILRNGYKLISIKELIISLIISLILSLYICFKIDSYFWNVNFIIPEFDSFLFNIIENNSKNWGIEPFYSYFLNYLPKLFLTQFDIVILLILIFFILSFLNIKNNYNKLKIFKIDYVNYGVGTITTLMWTSLFYIIFLSINGHKEWRFLIYTIPIFCIGSANIIEFLINKIKFKFKFKRKLILIFLILLYFFSLICSFLFAIISSWNYTGGNMAQKLNLRLINQFNNSNQVMLKPIIIHWDIGTCMNGGSLFVQINDNKFFRNNWENSLIEPKYWIIYDKTEDLNELKEIVNDFDYWVQYDDEELIPLNDDNFEWILIDILEGYNGINFNNLKLFLINPKKIIFGFKNDGFKFFKNSFDLIINKKIRGRVWEKSVIDYKNENNKININF